MFLPTNYCMGVIFNETGTNDREYATIKVADIQCGVENELP